MEQYLGRRYGRRLLSGGEFRAWMSVLKPLGEPARGSIQQLVCSRLSLHPQWASLSPGVRDVVVTDVTAESGGTLLRSASDAWLTRSGLGLADEIALAKTAAYRNQTEAAGLWCDLIAARVFDGQAEEAPSDRQRQAAVVALNRLGYQAEAPDALIADQLEVTLGYPLSGHQR